MDAEQFKKFRENARKLEQLNRSKPKVRPTCDRQQKLLIWEDELRKRKVQNDIVITIGVKHACCYKQSSELEAINLRDLEVPKIHASRYLVCRTITEPIYNITASVLIEDTNSDIELLELYNFQTDFNASPSWLPTGKIILIKEPYLKFTSLEQNIALQVASPSDIVFIDETDEKFLKEVGALVWFNLDKMSFEELKLQGNECYKKGNYEEALKYYSRALKYQPTSPIIHLNCAATFLALERYYEAYQAAKSALDNGADLQKALFRLGKAAYGMRDWQKSSQHFIDLIKQFPNCNDAKKELTRALARLKESRAGQFDLSSLFNQFHYDGVCYFDIADYVGPVKIANIPGKGKGLIATSDIEPGTLLTVSKAFSTVYPTHNQININVIDINSDYIISQTQLRHMIETMQVLKRNPHRTKELYAKYSGEDMQRDVDVPEGVIDSNRIEKICIYNHDVLYLSSKQAENDDPVGLWLLPSYMNHSCLGNTYRTSYGDIKIVYSIDYIKSGEEITFNYINPDKSMILEERIRVQIDGDFKCQCYLCELDRSDPFIPKREALGEKIETINQQYAQSNSQQAIKLIEPLVDKLRQTYQKRKELQTHLYIPLNTMAKLYYSMKQYEKAAELLKEFDEKISEFKVVQSSNMGIEAMILLAKCYEHMQKQELAHKYKEKAFLKHKIRSGADEKIFKQMFCE